MIKLTQSTARTLPVMLIDSDDHVAPKTGIAEGSVTVVTSKDGGALTGFTLTGLWTELGQGLYTIDFAIGDLNTVGYFAYLVTAAGCDQYSGMMYVEAAAVTAATIADAVWDEVLTGATHNAATSAGRRLRQASDTLIIHDESCQAGGAANELILDAGASDIDDFYINDIVILTSGPGSIQARHIDSYVGADRKCILNREWDDFVGDPPDGDTNFVIRANTTVHIHGLTAEGLAEINAEVDRALDTAIPAVPTGGSINDVLGETYAAAVIAAGGVITINAIEGDIGDLQDDVDTVQASIDAAQAYLDYIYQKERGRWKIESNQLTYYEDDGVTVLRRFNLFNKVGVASGENPYERVPV